MPYKDEAGKLGFEFTSKYSSVVDVKLLDSLTHIWSSSDPILNKKLSDKGDVNTFKLTHKDFIMEKAYDMSMIITNV